MLNGAVELLGFELTKEGTGWRRARKKFWRLAAALQFILEGGACCTGREVERLVGHIVSVFSASCSACSARYTPSSARATCGGNRSRR